jgi:signal peptidase
LTKGDNNPVDDLDLYQYRQMYLDRESELSGIAKFYIPKIGYSTIWLTGNQYVKNAILGLVLLTALFDE